MRPCAVVLVIALLLPVPVHQAGASPSLAPQVSLDQGRLAYERGDYAEAIAHLHPLLYPRIELGTEEAVVETHRLLALAHFFGKQEREAEEEVSALLTLRPNFELDPVVDPPSAVSFFQDVKRRQEARLAEIRRRQLEEETRRRKEEEKRAEAARAKAERVFVERTIERHSRLIAMLPFGAGQFQNHQVGYGVGFAVSEVLLGAAWASLTFAIDLRFPDHKVQEKDQDLANALLGVQVASGAAFWAVVAWGIIDAQIKFKAETVVRSRELPGAPPAQPTKHPTTTFAPIISPRLYGLGVQGVF